jgi:hypothetical protein
MIQVTRVWPTVYSMCVSMYGLFHGVFSVAAVFSGLKFSREQQFPQNNDFNRTI